MSGAETRLTGADRVLVALRMLAQHPRGMRVEDLRRELGTPKSTAHRILGTLRRSGFATQGEDGRYAVSMEFVRLAFNHYEALDDRNVVQGVLDVLVELLGETAYYARYDCPDIVYVGMRHPPGYLHTAAVVGARVPAYRTGLGKAILAYTLPNRRAVDRFVDLYGPLVVKTPTSVRNASQLDHELALVRRRGFAVDNEENEPGVVCIGFPLFLGPDSTPSGAVSVAAIRMRTPLETLVSHADEIRAVIERHLGAGAVVQTGWVPTGDQEARRSEVTVGTEDVR